MDPMIGMFGQLLLAAFLGLAIGTERSIVAQQRAGMRTFALVSLGACIFVLAGQYIDSLHFGLVNFDPARMAAAVVQGIGFIGAGLIFMRGDSVHGITTAAGLWVVSSIGVLVAFKLYALAIFAAALTIGIFFALWYVERLIKRWHGLEQDDKEAVARVPSVRRRKGSV
jgi:putative Mg2+ transporter-C (MgtC) family protein